MGNKKWCWSPFVMSFPCQVAMLVLSHSLLPMSWGSMQDKHLRVKQSPSRHAARAQLPQVSVRLEVETGPEGDEAFIKSRAKKRHPASSSETPPERPGWATPAAWLTSCCAWGVSSCGVYPAMDPCRHPRAVCSYPVPTSSPGPGCCLSPGPAGLGQALRWLLPASSGGCPNPPDLPGAQQSRKTSWK